MKTEKDSDKTLFAGYKGGAEMPLEGYAALLGIFNLSFAGLLLAAKRSKNELPENIQISDLILMGLATHKLSRIISSDRITSPLRAPFTEYIQPDGASEVKEKVRGRGLRRAVGDLLHCPYCLAPWIAAGLVFGTVFKPKTTRLITATFAVSLISETIQHFYDERRHNENKN